MLPHDVRVFVRDEERDVVIILRLSLQHDEVFCSHHEETSELSCQHCVQFVHLLNFHAESKRVDTRLNQASFALVTADFDGVQDEFFVTTTHTNNRWVRRSRVVTF